jgi:uncharacterized protein YehS (DUF1456 family)
MQDFIISEATKIFCKGIKRYAAESKKEESEVSLMLYLKGEDEEGYKVCYNNQPVKEVSLKDILNVKFDLKGYTVFVPPHIIGFLNGFKEELGSEQVDVCVYLDKEDDEMCRFFLFNKGKFVKEVYLTELIKV